MSVARVTGEKTRNARTRHRVRIAEPFSFAPSPTYSGERAGERGKVVVTSMTGRFENRRSVLQPTGSRRATPLAPLPCTLPGVPGRGSGVSWYQHDLPVRAAFHHRFVRARRFGERDFLPDDRRQLPRRELLAHHRVHHHPLAVVG